MLRWFGVLKGELIISLVRLGLKIAVNAAKFSYVSPYTADLEVANPSFL